MLPKIDRSIPTPIYQQVVEWIREQISSEQWPENYQLMAEEDFAKELGISRGTIRKAVSTLIDEGLLTRIHGRGTFVSASVIEQPLAEQMVTFSEDLMQRGIHFETRVLRQQIIEPPPQVAALLQIKNARAAFYLKRVRIVNDEPVILLKNYVVAEHCPNIEEIDFTKYRLFQTLEEIYKLELAAGSRVFEAAIADDEVAPLLALPDCSPVMHMQQITYMQDNQPIELSHLWLRADRYRISANVSRLSATQKTTSLKH